MSPASRSSSSACPGSPRWRSALLAAGRWRSLIGALAIRTRGIYFAMVTLALAQMRLLRGATRPSGWTGGENGLRGINVARDRPPRLADRLPRPAEQVLRDAGVRRRWRCALLSRILASPFGAVIEAIRENETRARACGYDVERTKLLSFVLSGLILRPGRRAAGAAPVDRAARDPALPDLGHGRDDDAAGRRRARFFGPFVGAAGVPAAGGCGLALDAALAALRRRRLRPVRAVPAQGDLGHAARTWMRDRHDDRRPSSCDQAASARRFGGFIALNGHHRRCSGADAHHRRSSAPTAPARARYFNLLSGALPPSAARIQFEGRDLTGAAAAPLRPSGHRQVVPDHQRLSATDARTRTSASRLQALRVALRHLARPRAGCRAGRAGRAAAGRGRPVGTRGTTRRRSLAHGEQRALEIAMALAAEPGLLLLDEPTAGMGPEETQDMMDLIVRLAERAHRPAGRAQDEDGAGAVSDRILVLHHGRAAGGRHARPRSRPTARSAGSISASATATVSACLRSAT